MAGGAGAQAFPDHPSPAWNSSCVTLTLAEHGSMASQGQSILQGGKHPPHQLGNLRESWTVKGPRIGSQMTFWLWTHFPELEFWAQGAYSLCLPRQGANQRHTGTLPSQAEHLMGSQQAKQRAVYK